MSPKGARILEEEMAPRVAVRASSRTNVRPIPVVRFVDKRERSLPRGARTNLH